MCLVFLNHASVTKAVPSLLTRMAQHPYLGFAGHGVKLFFVISGFLITSILLRELARSGAIDGMAFLRRRARRILPALLCFLLVVGVLRWMGVYTFDWRHLIAALTFTGRTGSWELGHLWSLAVQEQFNLAWALVLALGGRRFASHCAVAAVILVPIARVVLVTFDPDAASLYLTNGASIDTIALGCLLALHRERLATQRWFNAVVDSRYWIPLIYVIAASSLFVGSRPSILVRTPLVAVALVLLVERCIRHPDRGWARWLTTPAVLYLGSASYSLYLWQQLFLKPGSPSWTNAFPVNVLAAVAVGLLSWHLIERPYATRRLGTSVALARLSAARATWLARYRASIGSVVDRAAQPLTLT